MPGGPPGQSDPAITSFFVPGGNVESGISENIRKGSFDKSYCGSINSIAVSALDADIERNKGIKVIKGIIEIIKSKHIVGDTILLP